MENDQSYFMRRAAQERSAEVHARGKAREAHKALAKYYEERVQAAEGAPPQAA